jgi:hypothetical protein
MTLCELTLNGKIYRGELLNESLNKITLKHIISEEISTYVLPDVYSITKQQILDENKDVGSLQRIFNLIKNLDVDFFTKEEIYEITQNYDVDSAIKLHTVLKTLKIKKENISESIVKDALIRFATAETETNIDFINNDNDLDQEQKNILVLNFKEILNSFIKSLEETNTITDMDLNIPDIFKIEGLEYFYKLKSIMVSI